ncbi:hypothetical protein CQR55_1060 [Bifidobacterium pseudolongum subsp. globosum]|uniref:hypothetical protein n=1 Tax=Bifidobacterium pseudolongum TaxID=1694 RepID=UPI000C70D7B5|nr:hypothetical protein [Bifidobacterium pseudolongum]PKU96725.1 hypothetical protein CQR55_1060 [Bifidobacterium pseudolongum subsp. globosum]
MTRPEPTANAQFTAIIDHIMDQALADRHDQRTGTRHTMAAYHTGQLVALAALRAKITGKEPTT